MWHDIKRMSACPLISSSIFHGYPLYYGIMLLFPSRNEKDVQAELTQGGLGEADARSSEEKLGEMPNVSTP